MEELRSLTDLLDLQAVDSRIDRLIEQRQNLPALEEYRSADARLRELIAERDAAAAQAAAERLVTTDGVSAIMGADCSGVTGAILQNVAVPNGVVMISPVPIKPSAPAPGDG